MHSWYNIGIKPQQPTKASCRDRQHYPDNTVYSRAPRIASARDLMSVNNLISGKNI